MPFFWFCQSCNERCYFLSSNIFCIKHQESLFCTLRSVFWSLKKIITLKAMQQTIQMFLNRLLQQEMAKSDSALHFDAYTAIWRGIHTTSAMKGRLIISSPRQALQSKDTLSSTTAVRREFLVCGMLIVFQISSMVTIEMSYGSVQQCSALCTYLINFLYYGSLVFQELQVPYPIGICWKRLESIRAWNVSLYQKKTCTRFGKLLCTVIVPLVRCFLTKLLNSKFRNICHSSTFANERSST